MNDEILKFNVCDWLKDDELRSVSLAARGLWIEMLCLMYVSSRRGFLQHQNGQPVSAEQLARKAGCSPDEVLHLLQELESIAVFSRTEDTAIIFSRRMAREARKRQLCVEAGKRGGNPTLKGVPKGQSKGSVKGPSQPKQSPKVCAPKASIPDLKEEKESNKEKEETEEKLITTAGDMLFDTGQPRVLLTFPCDGPGGSWHLTDEKLSEWKTTFPSLEIMTEIRKALQWIRDNPTQRKTATGMPRFIGNWLSNAQNRNHRGTNQNNRPDTRPGFRAPEQAADIAKLEARTIKVRAPGADGNERGTDSSGLGSGSSGAPTGAEDGVPY